MRPMCDQGNHEVPVSEQHLAALRRMMVTYGWALQASFANHGEDGDAALIYTVGLHGRGWPELVMRDVDPDFGQNVLNTLAGRWVGQDGPDPLGSMIEMIGTGGRMGAKMDLYPEPAETLRVLKQIYGDEEWPCVVLEVHAVPLRPVS